MYNASLGTCVANFILLSFHFTKQPFPHCMHVVFNYAKGDLYKLKVLLRMYKWNVLPAAMSTSHLAIRDVRLSLVGKWASYFPTAEMRLYRRDQAAGPASRCRLTYVALLTLTSLLASSVEGGGRVRSCWWWAPTKHRGWRVAFMHIVKVIKCRPG